MIKLSYTSLNSAIKEPHTWLCKQMGLKTTSSPAMLLGKAAHEIVQKHLSGAEIHPILKEIDLPALPVVEEKDFDERLKFIFTYREYEIRGFLDARKEDWSEIGDIKSGGKVWSGTDFAKSDQFPLYTFCKPEIQKVWLIAVPINLELWSKDSIKIHNTDVTAEYRARGKDFIDRGIHVIEHINDFELYKKEPSFDCYYIGCPFCGGRTEENGRS